MNSDETTFRAVRRDCMYGPSQTVSGRTAVLIYTKHYGEHTPITRLTTALKRPGTEGAWWWQ